MSRVEALDTNIYIYVSGASAVGYIYKKTFNQYLKETAKPRYLHQMALGIIE